MRNPSLALAPCQTHSLDHGNLPGVARTYEALEIVLPRSPRGVRVGMAGARHVLASREHRDVIGRMSFGRRAMNDGQGEHLAGEFSMSTIMAAS